MVSRDDSEVHRRIADEYDRIILRDALRCQSSQIDAAPAPPEDQCKSAAASFGCGSPVAISDMQPGDVVLDLGCGAGADLLWAAAEVGPTGRVIGVDVSNAMIDRARCNAVKAGFDNIVVHAGLAEDLPVEEESVDWVISNCVINLSPNKPRVFAEIVRVLKPGGRMRVADVVAEGLPEWVRRDPKLRASCIGGAISEHDYVSGLRDAGLTDIVLGGRYVYDRHQLAAIAAVARPLRIESIRVANEIVGRVWSVHVSAAKPLRERSHVEAGRPPNRAGSEGGPLPTDTT